MHPNFDGSNGFTAKTEGRRRTNKNAKKRRTKSALGNKETPADTDESKSGQVEKSRRQDGGAPRYEIGEEYKSKSRRVEQ
jgi:hypothetical protein